MKIDRLIGILSILLQEEKTTAPELAEKLGLHFFLGDGFFARGIDRNLIRVKK